MTFLSSLDVRLMAKRIAAVGALFLLVPIASWAHSSAVAASGTCFPSSFVCTSNTGGMAVGGVTGMEMDGLNGSQPSTLQTITDSVGAFKVAGTLSLTTGAFSAASFGTGKCAASPCTLGTFAPGTLTINVTDYRGFTGVLFNGTFGD